MSGLSSSESPYLCQCKGKRNPCLKSISIDIWQYKYLLAFKPYKTVTLAKTNSIVVAAIDSEYFSIGFVKQDCCCGRHLVKSESSSNMATPDKQSSQ